MGVWLERWKRLAQPDCQEVVQEQVQRGCSVQVVQMRQVVRRIALGRRQSKGQTTVEGACESEGSCQ